MWLKKSARFSCCGPKEREPSSGQGNALTDSEMSSATYWSWVPWKSPCSWGPRYPPQSNWHLRKSNCEFFPLRKFLDFYNIKKLQYLGNGSSSFLPNSEIRTNKGGKWRQDSAKVVLNSEGSGYLRKKEVLMDPLGSPWGQAYFLEFPSILKTVIPGLAFLLISLECAVLNYWVG